MSDLTLMEAAKGSADFQVNVVTKQIVEASPILEYAPVRTIPGAAYKYFREASLGSIGYRAVGGSYIADSGVINPEVETLVILGGEVFADNFEIATMGGTIAVKPAKYQMKSRSMGIFFSQEFFEGDKTVTPTGLDGIRRRITASQLINAATGGATLTLAMIDELLDAVVGGADALFMNKTLRRKTTALVRAQTGSSLISVSADQFGRQQTHYAGVPIRIVEREDDASTIFGFDEDDGSANLDTASIYAIKFGNQYCHVIANSGLPSVKDFGESETRPGHLGRIEWFAGLAIEHQRAVARLYHINNA